MILTPIINCPRCNSVMYLYKFDQKYTNPINYYCNNNNCPSIFEIKSHPMGSKIINGARISIVPFPKLFCNEYYIPLIYNEEITTFQGITLFNGKIKETKTRIMSSYDKDEIRTLIEVPYIPLNLNDPNSFQNIFNRLIKLIPFL